MPQEHKIISAGAQSQYIEHAASVVQNNISITGDVSPKLVSSILSTNGDCSWMPISYDNQIGLEHAIAGYRLLPSSINSCPRIPQIKIAKEKLDSAHYVFITGEAGCGKSITAYQLAHDYYMDGWSVFRLPYEHNNNMHLNVDSERALFIIDDAQYISHELINKLICETNKDIKLIVTQTKSLKSSEDTVVLLNKQAVDTIYNHYLIHKHEIISLIIELNKKSGRHIGDMVGYTSFEFALKVAKRERTPWLFNYSLRGGWGNSSYLFDSAKENDRADILLTLISLKQILSLDKPVALEWIYSMSREFERSVEWCDNNLSFLSENHKIISIDEIRAIHIQMAYLIFVRFIETASKNEMSIFISVVQKEILDESNPLMGSVWLYNSIFTHAIYYQFSSNLLTDDFANRLLERCMTQGTSENRMQAAYVMEGILHKKYRLLDIVENSHVLKLWIEDVDSTTAYAYSQIINAMINESNEQKKAFVSTLNIDVIMNKIKNISSDALYGWASFLNRLICYCTKATLKEIIDFMPRREISQALLSVELEQLYGAFEMLCSLHCIDEPFAFEAYNTFLPVLKKFFLSNFGRAVEQMDIQFFMYIFGRELFVRMPPTKSQKNAADAFSKCITSDMLSKYIENGTPREWDKLYQFWSLLSRYNHKMVEGVVPLLDFSLIEKNTQDMWEEQSREFENLLFMLYDSNPDTIDNWIYKNRDSIKEVTVPLLYLSIQTAEYVFNKNCVCCLKWNHSWENVASVLSELYKQNVDFCSKIIQCSMKEVKSDFYKLSAFDHETYHYFLGMLLKVNPNIIDVLCSEHKSIEALKFNWKKNATELMNKEKDKKSKKGFIKFLSIVHQNTENQCLIQIIDECFRLLEM
ncbi:MAG: mS29 family ribosomal protein [Defluviitaleaceae bacterium]|nr:mS29 family ribosomal protein [Defluviitaleaceae bacterium]